MTDYRVRVKAASDADWKNCSTAIIAVSLGNDGTKGDKLRAIVDWINAQPNFTRCVIDLSDSLYAWNLTDEHGDLLPDAGSQARALGDEWLGENASVLIGLRITPEIIRWNHWLGHPKFKKTEDAFIQLYGSDGVFTTAVNMGVARFMLRKLSAGPEPLLAKLADNNRHFIFEELAAHTLLHKQFPSAAKIYPGTTPEVFRVIKSGRVPNAPRGLETQRRVEIRIERAPHFADEMRALPRTDRQPV
jgi:hypothetical protein